MTTRSDAHRPEFHREHAWKHPVRCATTANITIASGLNAGDTIDGITLVAGDRVLVKDQTSGAENGIYDVGVTPVRSYDLDSGIEAWGCLVRVLAGTANAGKVFGNTNTTLPTIDTTALTFAEFGAGSALTVKDEGTPLATAATSVDFVGAGVTATGSGAGKTVTIPGNPLTVKDEGTPLATDASSLDFVGAGVTATGAAGAKTVTIPGSPLTVKDEGSALATDASSLDFVGAGVVASGTGAAKTITIPGGTTSGDASAWKPVMASNPNIVTADGAAVWTPLVTVEGDAVMAFVPL